MLSILIPTFNRAKLLDRCLKSLEFMESQDEPFEIVISDNCSQDNTFEVVQKHQKTKPYIKYYKMKTHKDGGLGNFINALRRCEGDFCVYHADDDKLVPEVFLKYFHQLKKSNDDVVAITAPFVAYNDELEKVSLNYVTVKESFRFSLTNIQIIMEWVIVKEFFPEIMILKTAAYRNALGNSSIYKGCEAMEAFFNLLLQGDILVEPEPFYLEIAVHKPEMEFDSRQRSNCYFEMAAPDNVQHGLEVFVGRLLHMLPPNSILQDQIDLIKRAILNRGVCRQNIAANKFLFFNDYIHAKHLFWRTSLHVKHSEEKIQQDINSVILSCIQSTIFTAKAIDIDKIYLSGFDNNELVQNAFQHLGWDQKVETYVDQLIDDSIILTKHNTDQQKALDSGFKPGFILSIESLINNFKSQNSHYDLAGL